MGQFEFSGEARHHAVMQAGHPKTLSKETVLAFSKLVPTATVKGGSLATWQVNGREAGVRIKRAAELADQIHVWWGEPIAVHVPQIEHWYVLPVSWQLSYARAHAKTAKQHASHAFECMMVSTEDLPATCRVLDPPSGLRSACEAAMIEAMRKDIRFIIKAVGRLRDTVADVLIDTFKEEFADEF